MSPPTGKQAGEDSAETKRGAGKQAAGNRGTGKLDGGKLAAYLDNTGREWTIEADEAVLYLGAAQGSSAAWMAQHVPEATIAAVEKSPVAALGLVETARQHPNLVPLVADARDPASYAPAVPELGVLYQDVAQKDQVEIFLANVEAFGPRRGYLSVKAPSIAVDRAPEEIFQEAVALIGEVGDTVDVARLEPHHKDHAMIVADFQGAQR